ncbi:PIR protein [Plasmodium vivax]|uniref:VIR protein n=1 Tax=Plasmodium vivax TaxID=5855 RepID=A0A565A4U6_PLAVI|nr:PIR protein [Plasmodium vivax]
MSEKKSYKTHKFLETSKGNFNLYKFYDHFKIDIDDSYSYYKTCNYTATAGSNNRCHTIKQITQKWKEKFDKFTPVDNNIVRKCDLLVLWVYDKIIGCDSDNYCISWYYGLLEKFWDESNCCEKEKVGNKDQYICKNKFIKTFNLDVLKNKRDSYDFFEYYEYVKNILFQGDQIKEKYCEYIKYILKLYHELKEENRLRGLPHIYEKELNLYKNTIDKENTLSLLKKNCNIDDYFIKPPQSTDSINSLQGNYGKKLTKHPVPPSYGQYNQIIKNEYENIIKELPSYKIYDELSKDTSGSEYKSKYCDNLKFDNDQMKTICKNMENNIKTLSNNSEMNGLGHRDRCRYLNFWIYGEISKLHTNEDKNLTDITDVANLIDANIKINNDLIKEDFDVNYKDVVPETSTSSSTTTSGPGDSQASGAAEKPLENGETTTPSKNEGGEGPRQNENAGRSAQSGGIGGAQNNEGLKEPAKFVKYYDFSKYKPCYFNYDCTFSECREMKHLYEYFKAYDKIKGNIKCEHRKKDKYYTYLKYMKSHDQEKCNEIKKLSKPNLSEEKSIDPKEENNMYIKYFTCSYVTDSTFKKKGLRCQQPGYSPFRKNKFAAVRALNNAENDNLKLKGKKLTINGKSINAVLISDPHAKITGEDVAENAMPDDQYTLFPEIRGAARKAYVKQAREACKNGEIKEGMEEYCRKSKRYNKIINLSNSQSANVTLKEDIENWEDIVIPDDTSFLNEILQRLPVRMGAVSLASLGAITMLFMYYKFTPLGSWLRNVMGGEKKMKHGNHGEPRKSLNYQQDHMSQISQTGNARAYYLEEEETACPKEQPVEEMSEYCRNRRGKKNEAWQSYRTSHISELPTRSYASNFSEEKNKNSLSKFVRTSLLSSNVI